MNEATYKGSCLCESVIYEITSEPQQFYLCHCEQCRKITGSAFASNILTKTAEIVWLSGSDKIRRYDHPTRDFTKVFCAECGSGLPFVTKSKKRVIIPAGSLNSETVILPSNNIFWGDKSGWIETGLKAKHCEDFPE